MKFEEFSKANRTRCAAPNGFNHDLHAWTLSDWMTATLGELGEAANVVKKLNRYRDGINGNKEAKDVLRDKLRREVGDAFIYLDLMAQAAGFTVKEAAVESFNAKSIEIGYPVLLDGYDGTRPGELELFFTYSTPADDISGTMIIDLSPIRRETLAEAATSGMLTLPNGSHVPLTLLQINDGSTLLYGGQQALDEISNRGGIVKAMGAVTSQLAFATIRTWATIEGRIVNSKVKIVARKTASEVAP